MCIRDSINAEYGGGVCIMMADGWLMVHVLAEMVAGVTLLLSPSVLVPGVLSADHTEALRSIGNGAITVGFIGVALLLASPPDRPRWAYAVIAQYHLGVVVLQLRHPMVGVPYGLAAGFHGLLLGGFVWLALAGGGTKDHSPQPKRTA
eukprot:TRINITY_DN27377_c0_g1_i1.p2 TRINITY_DN27377_c0_g1~~TRINITY_DN27377_c0_g1_i1.p2  ORF type:complete len:148 (-),score=22.73 TRINITY_DN27377_c0_g1_i1:378-821(-)